MTYEAIFAALGDPTRRLVFDRLRQGPMSVAALAEGLPVSRPAVSQHLKILKEAGLVHDAPQGAQRIYRLNWTGLAALKGWLDGFEAEAQEVYAAEVQRQIDERKYT